MSEELKLKPCPFCGKAARIKIYNHTVKTKYPNGSKPYQPYFSVIHKLGCFDCGVTFDEESAYTVRRDGSIEIFLNGFNYAAEKWNRRAE